METGFEAAKGAAEKVLGVKLPILMRMILPGLLATAVLYPFMAWLLNFLPPDADHLWQRILAYAVLVLLLGALISTANSEIYKIYEGRIFWPPRLREWACQKQQARVTRLMKAAETAPTLRRNELWYQLRVYPLNTKGDPEATHPTMVGNILAGYEQYPNNRYGMDSVFYWPRIWLQIDKDKKEEIDSQWSVADGFLTLSAISYAGSVVWTVQALAALFGLGLSRLPFGAPGLTFAGVAGWLLLGFFWYLLSLPFHRENGEVFKAIFDIYRNTLSNMTSLKPDEKEDWYATWAYLQYLFLKCPNCNKFTSALGETCGKCGFGLVEVKRNLRSSGKFPTGP